MLTTSCEVTEIMLGYWTNVKMCIIVVVPTKTTKDDTDRYHNMIQIDTIT